MTRQTGTYTDNSVAGETIRAFIPHPLPPRAPSIEFTPERQQLLNQASEGLRRLELAGSMVPTIPWFVYAFVRKEAVVSSQIEGTQATLVDLLSAELATPNQLTDDADIEEASNSYRALRFALDQIRDPNGLPLSMRLLNDSHQKLLSGTRGAQKQPGRIRRSQNWIGGSRPGNAAFVPPPPQELPRALSQLEEFIHNDTTLPALIRVGLCHVQFETIHPYLDGNGRIGRLLISLLLEHYHLLNEPLLFLSLYFKQNRDEYYRRLSAVRKGGDWEGWIDYFLRAVVETATEAENSAKDLFQIVTIDRDRVLNAEGTTLNAVKLLERLPQQPLVTIARVCDLLGTTKPTAGKAVELLVKLGVLEESTGRERSRTFWYARYIERLRAGTELI